MDLFWSKYFIQDVIVMNDQCFSCMCWYADTIQEQTCLGNMATRLMKVLSIAKKMTRNTRVLIYYQTNKFRKKPSCFPYFIVSIPLFVHRLPYSASWTIFHVRVIAKSGYIYNEQIIVIAVFVLSFIYSFSGPRLCKVNPCSAESLLKVQYICIFYHVSTLR